MTPSKARELLSYDQCSGQLFWKVRNGEDLGTRVFNSQYAGKAAGKINKLSCGYKNIYVCCLGKNYLAHRLAWMIMTGEKPPKAIDHINGDSTDNRWENLRDGTLSNRKNCSKYKNNKSGVNGVVWDKRRRRWEARCAGKYLGRFDDIEDAKAARREFEAAAGYTLRHGRKLASYYDSAER